MMTLLNIPGMPFDLHVTNPTWIFFLVLIIILFAPMILGRLHIPHIVGMILAGMVIGEYGFDILARDSSFELFGKVGLLYIMFLAGLEMNMEDFKNIRVKATVLGLLAFIFPLGIGFWVNLNILEYGAITSLLLASMYASHTLVAYPIVSRYGINRQRSVGIAVGGTAVTDTLTLLVLAVISGLYKSEASEYFWVWLVMKFIVLSIIIMYTFPRIARWFFRRYSDNVMQYIFVMAMAFLGAGLMEAIGMEGILGAFLVGLVLNRQIPHVSPLMNHLEFVGNALFIPYFLIGVGMMINVNILFGHIDSIKVAIVMIVVALAGKWIASWLTQKIFKMRAIERELMFGLSNAQAAATLAAVLVGYNIILPNGERLLNEDVLNGTIFLILVTCIVSSFVTERAAARIVKYENSEEDFKEKNKQENENILIPIANPDTVEDLMNMALTLKNEKKTTQYTALSVVLDVKESGSNDEIKGKRLLERAANIAAAADTQLTMISRYDINIALGMLHTIKERNISEVVIGLHRKTNIVDSFFGNILGSLLKGTSRQIMIVKSLVPVNTIKAIDVAVPPMAEYEIGFKKWIDRICRFAQQTGSKITFHANDKTAEKIELVIKSNNISVRYEMHDFPDYDDFLILTKYVGDDHMLVVISARHGTISHNATLDKLSTYLGKYFYNNSFIVVFPEQHAGSEIADNTADTHAANVIVEQDNKKLLEEDPKS